VAIERFQLYRGKPNLQDFKEGATQTFNRGDIVKLSSNLVVIATGTGLGNVILGVAAADASGTTSAKIPVYVVTPEQEWRAFPKSTKKPTSFSLGVDYKIKQASAGAAEVSTSTNAAADVVVVAHALKNNDGTTAGDPMLVRFDVASCVMIEG
jgi:hypothetical protein